MRKAKQVREDLISILDSTADMSFAEMGFTRNKRSIDYIRVIGDSRQIIAMSGDYSPRYQQGAELRLGPMMRLEMMCLADGFRLLASDDKMLLNGSLELVVNQPIEFTAPKIEHVRWFATGHDQLVSCVTDAVSFISRWVKPFLDEVTTIDDLIRVYKTDDKRMLKQDFWYLYIAAAYMVKGDDHSALQVLEDKLGKPGLRKRYPSAFELLEKRVRSISST